MLKESEEFSILCSLTNTKLTSIFLYIFKLQGHRATEQVPRRVPDAQRGVEAGQRPHDCGQRQDQDIGRAGPVHSHRIRETVSENHYISILHS